MQEKVAIEKADRLMFLSATIKEALKSSELKNDIEDVKLSDKVYSLAQWLMNAAFGGKFSKQEYDSYLESHSRVIYLNASVKEKDKVRFKTNEELLPERSEVKEIMKVLHLEHVISLNDGSRQEITATKKKEINSIIRRY